MKTTYGAAELKDAYNGNLGVAFSVALNGLGLLVLLYAILSVEPVVEPLVLPRKDTTTIVLPPIKTDKKNEGKTISGDGTNGPDKTASTEGPARHDNTGGSYKATSDSVKVDTSHITSMTTLRTSGTNNGVGTLDGGNGGSPNGNRLVDEGGSSSGTLERPQATPDEDPPIFNPNVSEPDCDQIELRRNLTYPDIARRNDIEGRVVVRVLIDKRGVPTKHFIEYTDNSLLDDAAVDAILHTKFKPGMNGDQPAAAWVFVPIKFTLHP